MMKKNVYEVVDEAVSDYLIKRKSSKHDDL